MAASGMALTVIEKTPPVKARLVLKTGRRTYKTQRFRSHKVATGGEEVEYAANFWQEIVDEGNICGTSSRSSPHSRGRTKQKR